MTDRNRRPGNPVLTGFLIGYGVVFLPFLLLLLVSGSFVGGTAVIAVLSLLFGPALVGGLPGLLIGGVVMGVTSIADRNRPALPPQQPYRMPLPPPRVNDAWSRLLEACEQPVQRCDQALAAVPPSPAKDWLGQIVATMRAELPTARGLAETGRRLHPDRQPRLNEHPLYRRLYAATQEFAATERRIGEVITQLVAQPDLKRVDNQLQLLEQQLPHLRPAD
ncbi:MULTISPECIES: hypothetical protein [unclassified Crossiella]|uniref:hypothetical protein n=1 Tax=unclassified Crossiella TaxID=2620835 RepID=UPI001FFFA0F7|nr:MULTISPECIES: hypothetical protein [unclassified Crossiella]MCK2236770.1 hypothetical protein [Crossiella sp. S99.2]MCK2250438.1 hypothetical protein [Crossiella sp. S99.1]